MEKFIKELEVGEIHQRDKWQFELKSEFFPHPNLRKNTYTQEFYLFIPNSLQVNEESYSKQQFYQDETNFIRYKTPEFTLSELIDQKNTKSPLTRLTKLRNSKPTKENTPIVEDELKLLANVARSSLREGIRKMIPILNNEPSGKKDVSILKEVRSLTLELTEFRKNFFAVEEDFLKNWTSIAHQSYFIYIDEFLSDTVDFYLTGLLERVLRSNLSNVDEINEHLCAVLAEEKRHRTSVIKEPQISVEDSKSNEYILYRSGLLNKFVIDALLLRTTRSSVAKRFRHLIGSIAAGIAMLFFFVLFVKQGSVLILNSLPFIILTVLLYILKDRMKEWLQALSYRQFAKWFSDYKTEIFSPDGKIPLGKMHEYVSFVQEKDLSKELLMIRNREFHVVLETFKRPEQVLYFKRKIELNQTDKPQDTRRNALNIIFRFNISKFLEKADNPSQDYVTVDPESIEFSHTRLPKVYHLNIIQKNTYHEKDASKKIELRKFRLILDKNGIKRVEYFPHS